MQPIGTVMAAALCLVLALYLANAPDGGINNGDNRDGNAPPGSAATLKHAGGVPAILDAELNRLALVAPDQRLG